MKDIYKTLTLNCKPYIEILTYPSYVNYDITGKVREEFCKSGWAETRQQWRLYIMDKKLTKEINNVN